MSADDKPVGEAGALPTLDAKPVLGAPKVATKAKSNVTKLFYLLGGLAGFVFIIAGVIAYAKGHSSPQKTRTLGETITPATSKRNDKVANQSIDQFKAHLKEKDAQAAAIAARQASAAAAAAAAASAGGGSSAGLAAYDQAATAQGGVGQGGRPGQVGQVGQGAPGGQRAAGAGRAAAPAAAASRPLTAEERAMAGDVLVALPGEVSGGRRGADRAEASGGAVVAAAQESNDSLAASLKPTVFAAGRAGHPGNMDFLLEQGTDIPCALYGGLDTTLPGPTECQVTQDVYSANGVTKLVDRGAKVMGEHRSALRDGQHVTAVLWSRIHSGDVWIDVDSPGTDQMGYNGVPIDVDNHWTERIGAALMLSVIDDYATALAAKQSQSNGSGPTYNQTTQTGTSLAGKVLDHQINIPPTGSQKPARVVYIRVVRDVSFENVYALQR